MKYDIGECTLVSYERDLHPGVRKERVLCAPGLNIGIVRDMFGGNDTRVLPAIFLEEARRVSASDAGLYHDIHDVVRVESPEGVRKLSDLVAKLTQNADELKQLGRASAELWDRTRVPPVPAAPA
jgi:hypothetical protein